MNEVEGMTEEEEDRSLETPLWLAILGVTQAAVVVCLTLVMILIVGWDHARIALGVFFTWLTIRTIEQARYRTGMGWDDEG